MLEIPFKSMKVLDNRTIQIIGILRDKEIILNVSTIIAAYLIGTDNNITERITFGATDEQIEKCSETRSKAPLYQQIELPENTDRTIDCHVLTTEKNNGMVEIHAEDEKLCGWNNDCIIAKIPKETYEEVFGNKNDIKMKLTPRSMIIDDKY